MDSRREGTRPSFAIDFMGRELAGLVSEALILIKIGNIPPQARARAGPAQLFPVHRDLALSATNMVLLAAF